MAWKAGLRRPRAPSKSQASDQGGCRSWWCAACSCPEVILGQTERREPIHAASRGRRAARPWHAFVADCIHAQEGVGGPFVFQYGRQRGRVARAQGAGGFGACSERMVV